MKTYRVLHVMSGYGGGVASHVRNIILGTDPAKLQIDIAAFTDFPASYRQEVEKKGGNVYVLDNVRIKILPRCINQFAKIVRQGGYDAVHLHVTDIPAVYFSAIARRQGIKRIIVHAHISSRPDEHTLMGTFKYALFRKITVLSATDLASCSKWASKFRFGEKYVRQNRIMHIPNSIDSKRYFSEWTAKDADALKQELGIEPDVLVVGHVGYFGYQKNHPFMLQIIQQLQKTGIRFVWLFIGTGPEEAQIQQQARDLGLSENIRFLGRREDVDHLYKIMDVSILPSHYEGLPTVAIESQAAGTPILVSDAITDECDMKMGIFQRLSLEENLSVWVDALVNSHKGNTQIPAAARAQQIRKLGFTMEAAAELYFQFIAGKVKFYNLGEPIDVHV